MVSSKLSCTFEGKGLFNVLAALKHQTRCCKPVTALGPLLLPPSFNIAYVFWDSKFMLKYNGFEEKMNNVTKLKHDLVPALLLYVDTKILYSWRIESDSVD